MACYHCHQPGHIAKFCKVKKNQPVNQSVDWKGEKKADVEETKDEMNRIWKKKSDDKPSEESNSSPSVENPSPSKLSCLYNLGRDYCQIFRRTPG